MTADERALLQAHRVRVFPYRIELRLPGDEFATVHQCTESVVVAIHRHLRARESNLIRERASLMNIERGIQVPQRGRQDERENNVPANEEAGAHAALNMPFVSRREMVLGLAAVARDV